VQKQTHSFRMVFTKINFFVNPLNNIALGLFFKLINYF
jgi:hypothetical protein